MAVNAIATALCSMGNGIGASILPRHCPHKYPAAFALGGAAPLCVGRESADCTKRRKRTDLSHNTHTIEQCVTETWEHLSQVCMVCKSSSSAVLHARSKGTAAGPR
eukprot:4378911-Prymnesium_polylepis.1